MAGISLRNLRAKESRCFHKVVLIYASKIPHNQFKNRPIYLDKGVVKFPCGQTFVYASELDLSIRSRMHRKVCPNPQEGHEHIRRPRKL